MSLWFPSILNLIISTIAFFVTAWYINRYLDEQGIGKGLTRSVLVFTFAILVAWGAGEWADWVQGLQNSAHSQSDLPQLLKGIGLPHP